MIIKKMFGAGAVSTVQGSRDHRPGLSRLSYGSLALVLGLVCWPALGYVGPGLGAGTLGVILGLIGSLLLAIVAFFWYPLKRVFLGRKNNKDTDEELEVAEPPVASAAEASSDSDQK